MAFGDKIKRKCKTCGNEFEGFPQSKYCSDSCKPKRDRRKNKVNEVKNDDGDNGTINDNNGIIGVGSDGTISDRNEDVRDIQQHNSGVQQDGTSGKVRNEIGSIQIIDGNTGKKEKGIIDQIFEKAFSPEYAPITTSLLGALAARLQQPNDKVEDGMLTADDGSKHPMI